MLRDIDDVTARSANVVPFPADITNIHIKLLSGADYLKDLVSYDLSDEVIQDIKDQLAEMTALIGVLTEVSLAA